MTILEKLIQKLNLPEIIKKKHGSSPEILSVDFLSALLENGTLTKTAEYLHIGNQTLNRLIVRCIRPQFGHLHGGNETWKYTLLASIEYKTCFSCREIKSYSKFGKDKHNSDGKFKKCRYCRSFDNASLYQERKLRIPAWYDLEKTKIADFYDACPEGWHVDHIIPLQGVTVSGLHTLSNLQYLPASVNIAKGNNFDSMGDW